MITGHQDGIWVVSLIFEGAVTSLVSWKAINDNDIILAPGDKPDRIIA